MMEKLVKEEIQRLIDQLEGMQANDGTWRFCFEGSIMTDAYMIILIKTLQLQEDILIKKLANRIASKQTENGAWKLFKDDNGNLSATVEAYFALLLSKFKEASDPEMKKAEDFILKNGGLKEVSSLTKVMLATTGQYPWPKWFPVPIELILLPTSCPINFFDFVGYARVHLMPILVLANNKFVIKRTNLDLGYLNSSRDQEDHFISMNSYNTRSLLSFIKQNVKKIIGLPNELNQMALEQAKQFMLHRIEPDGTLYSYFSSTFLMIFALLSLGFSKNDPVIEKAVKGLKGLACHTEGHIHMQNSPSTVWDTAFISHSLQASGINSISKPIEHASHYLLLRQQYKYGDWSIHNPNSLPGGWGFSESNTMNPDVDDTTAALRAIKYTISQHPNLRQSWYRGVNWLLSMQNNDGGWPAFEKNTDKEILKLVPFDGAESASIDPSTADLTGRTLEFLGNDARLTLQHPQVKRAVEWLENNQEKDGSWYGRWGITYIYGTWAAITGMRAIGVKSHHSSIVKGVQWLEEIQNVDGGWGESCKSDIERTYIPLGVSTPSQTAWALDSLISVYDHPTEEINKGIDCLIQLLNMKNWTYYYPTGAGLPGSFYIYYHSYNYIWPLLTLAHYRDKYS
ncbi:squalene--hopene cyclase [Bacillus sp. DJP31]|uniref:squalene--hopene cyclase n=1 Tax=Bacillus sp. DJP31 TaxID=3409789 RepID=UPI003BB7A2D6